MSTTQHNTPPPCAAAAARTITHNLRNLPFGKPLSHRAILSIGAQQSAPVIVRPAPMPTGRDA